MQEVHHFIMIDTFTQNQRPVVRPNYCLLTTAPSCAVLWQSHRGCCGSNHRKFSTNNNCTWIHFHSHKNFGNKLRAIPNAVAVTGLRKSIVGRPAWCSGLDMKICLRLFQPHRSRTHVVAREQGESPNQRNHKSRVHLNELMLSFSL